MRAIIAIAIVSIIAGAAAAQAPPQGIERPPPVMQNVDANYRNNLDRGTIAAGDYLPSGNAAEVKFATDAARAAGVECKVRDAATVRRRGKVVNYEIACEQDFGWVVGSKDGGKTFTAYECIALETSRQANGGMASCRLRANVNTRVGIEALTSKAGLKCPVGKFTYLGSGGTPPISRYEVMCGAEDYLIDTPTPKSQAKLQVISCKSAPNVCKLQR